MRSPPLPPVAASLALSAGDIEIVNNWPVFSVSNSETDLTTFELGVLFSF